jgi:hypothetical protein
MVTACPSSILSRATQAAVISILRLVVSCSPPLISSVFPFQEITTP